MVGIAIAIVHRFERWDNFEDEQERIIPAVLRRQHVLPDRLHLLDIYDDFDLYLHVHFP